MNVELHNFPYHREGFPQKQIWLPADHNDPILEIVTTMRTWEYRQLETVYTQAALRGDTFIEVGAHLGTDTIVAADYFPNLHCFEPSFNCRNVLTKNLAVNNIQARIYDEAVTDSIGSCFLKPGPPNESGSSSLVNEQQSKELDPAVVSLAKFTTLDSFSPLSTVNTCGYLHIDAEGQDIRALLGAKKFLLRQKNKPLIKIEFSPKTGASAADLVAFMAELHYTPLWWGRSDFFPITTGIILELGKSIANYNAWIDLLLVPT